MTLAALIGALVGLVVFVLGLVAGNEWWQIAFLAPLSGAGAMLCALILAGMRVDGDVREFEPVERPWWSS